MVAEAGYVITDVIHDLGDVLALGQRSDRAALDGVAGIHDKVRDLCQCSKLVERFVAAVDIVRVQDHDVIGCCGLLCGCRRGHGSVFVCECKTEGTHDQCQRQQKRNEFAVTHFCPPLDNYKCFIPQGPPDILRPSVPDKCADR